jgi:glycosyltransferase involved in cell wall biosynthesis
MNKSLKITFVLPGNGRNPIGGFKVVYEYANHLSRRGHQITLVHPAWLHTEPMPLKRILGTARYLYRKSTRGYTPASWFYLDPSIQILWVPSLNSRYIPQGDVIFATAWQTAEAIAEYPSAKGRPFYLIQHFETWSGSAERVSATWKLPLTKIVIAKWLQEMLENSGETAFYAPNGLDFERFSMDTPPEQRSSHAALMLYHELDWKGSKDGLKALSLVREQVPDFKAALFGVYSPPSDLPAWIEYHHRPDQKFLRRLYNEAPIFVAPSWAEGWPLPPAEAMMCGAALVATDIGGHREYAVNEQTALLSPAKSPELLADNILRLIRDPSLRLRLANQGHSHVQQFTWQKATDRLASLLPGD